MKRKSPYTIVNRPDDLLPGGDEREALVSSILGSTSDENKLAFASLSDALRRSVAATIISRVPQRQSRSARSSLPSSTPSPTRVNKLVEKLGSKERVATVGLLDLGAWVSELPRLLAAMNDAQRRFVFVELQTPVPAGMVKSEMTLEKWAEKLRDKRIGSRARAELQKNMLANEFMYFATNVGMEHGLDVVIGMTPAMIAYEREDGPIWNYYSIGVGSTALVSTYSLREYAHEANRPYEAAIGMLVIGQLLALRNEHLDYHAETRGCVFDFNEQRGGLMQSLKSMRIDDSCLELIPDEAERLCAVAILKSLASMKGPANG